MKYKCNQGPGSMGAISNIQWPALRDEQLYEELTELVYVKFDDIQKPIIIRPIAAQFNGIRGFRKIERKMFPLILCWAVTIHKLQGITFDKAVVNLGRKIFAENQPLCGIEPCIILERFSCI